MVTRALVENVKSNEELEVRIYAYDEIIADFPNEYLSNLHTARICSVPGFIPDFKRGDIVFICIEDNELDKPVVIGRCLLDKSKEDTVGSTRATLSKLVVTSNAVLSDDVRIGKVTKENIKCLEGARSRLQEQLDSQSYQKVDILKFLTDRFDKFADTLNSK